MKSKTNVTKRILFFLIYAAAVIFISFIGVFISQGLNDYSIYKAHSWIETEAHFSGSEAYQKTEHRRNHSSGHTHSFRVTRYKWEYCYELDGEQHYFTVDNKKESEPENPVRKIIAAEDDHSLYLRYGSGGVLVFMLVLGALIIASVIFAALCITIKVSRKAKHKNDDYEAYLEDT
ncbi:MAG: hypothetical protein HDT24_02770 [Ruminococcus sp.]|nr:hypothetical protein [Ruminococcus sp.]